MKHVLIIAVCFLSVTFVTTDEKCGPDANWEASRNTCQFRCNSDGVIFDCSSLGCQCENYEHYYNLDTKSCSEVKCDNMNCAGLQNELYFSGCESGSRDRCGCSRKVTMDCRRGCMCKNGFCRQNGVCVPRDCQHPYYS
ncbi:hypothetical protein ACKWTF_015365 [Chironomus riparius]